MRPGYVMSSVWIWFHDVGDLGPLYWRKSSMQLQRRGAKMRRRAVLVSCGWRSYTRCVTLWVEDVVPGTELRVVVGGKHKM